MARDKESVLLQKQGSQPCSDHGHPLPLEHVLQAAVRALGKGRRFREFLLRNSQCPGTAQGVLTAPAHLGCPGLALGLQEESWPGANSTDGRQQVCLGLWQVLHLCGSCEFRYTVLLSPQVKKGDQHLYKYLMTRGVCSVSKPGDVRCQVCLGCSTVAPGFPVNIHAG